jgi:hypothetical protein
MTTMEYDAPTDHYDNGAHETPAEPKPTRRARRAEPLLHENPITGRMLVAHIRLHAANLKADATSNGSDPDVVESEVDMLLTWAKQIEARLAGER